MNDSTLMSVQKEWTIDQEFMDLDNNQVDFMQVLDTALEVSGLHDQELQKQLNTQFIKANQSWVITQYEINIFDELSLGDIIQIDTRLVEVNRFFCSRRYSVMREDQLLCEIYSRFAAIDLEKRRIVRINPDSLVAGNIIDTNYKADFSKLTAFTEDMEEEAIRVPITATDIDENSHVNNLSYLKWVYKYLPDEMADRYQAIKIEVKYEKELLPEDEVLIKNNFADFDQQKSQHLIWNQTNKQLACILYIKWKERSL